MLHRHSAPADNAAIVLFITVLFKLLNPSEAFPDVFQGAVVVTAYPETAEDVLHDEYGYAYKDAWLDAELQMQSPVIVQSRSDDALGHIVGHAHLAVRNQPCKGAAQSFGLIISEKDARYKYDHEREVGQRRHKYQKGRLEVGIRNIITCHGIQTMKREEAY